MLLFLVVGCTAGPAEPTAVTSGTGPAPVEVAAGLAAPWSIAFAGPTALISERDTGNVLELTDPGTPQGGTQPVGTQLAGSRLVGTVPGVAHLSEGGLLGLAVYRAGSGPSLLYAYFTADQDNRILRFPLTGSAGSYGLGAAETVFTGIPKAANHNGGRIAFGPDGMLYVTTGDAGDRGSAQNPDALSGKILRLTPDGGVPADNPIAGNPLYSLGHRNPQGIGWAPDRTMWAAEFGQDTWDELNRIEPGANYGWPVVEGAAGDPQFTDPVQQWRPSEASPSGLVVTGQSIIIANLRGARLRVVPLADPTRSVEQWVGEYGRLRDAVSAPDGSVWVLTNNTDGRGSPRPGDDRILRLATS